MSTTTMAIRATDEVKAKFDELASLGNFENKSEFLKRLLTQYELEGKKQQVSVMKPAIEAVEELSSRLLEVLNGTAALLLTREEKQSLDFEEMKTEMQDRIDGLENERVADGERIAVFEAELAESKAEIESLENALKDKEALLKAHKDSADAQGKLDSILTMMQAQAQAQVKPKPTSRKAAPEKKPE